MQVRDWLFSESFAQFYRNACLCLERPIQFMTVPSPVCPRCPLGCPREDGEVTVLLDPRWTSRHAQQYATRAIFHYLLTREGFPAIRLKSDRAGDETARKLCYRLNWRVLGLVVNQKMDALFPDQQQDILLTDLFVNTVKHINVCFEHVYSNLELSLPALDIFYQYFTLRPRHQKQLIGTVKLKWAPVHNLFLGMVRLSEDYCLMDKAECRVMLEKIVGLLGVGDVVQVVYHPDLAAGQYGDALAAYSQLGVGS